MPDPLFWAGGDEAAGGSAVPAGPSVKAVAVDEAIEVMADERVELGDGVGAGPGASEFWRACRSMARATACAPSTKARLRMAMVMVLGAEMHRAACTGKGSSSVDSAGEPSGPIDPVFQGVARSSVTSSEYGIHRIKASSWPAVDWGLSISAREGRKKRPNGDRQGP